VQRAKDSNPDAILHLDSGGAQPAARSPKALFELLHRSEEDEDLGQDGGAD